MYSISSALAWLDTVYSMYEEIQGYLGTLMVPVMFVAFVLPSLLQFTVLKTAFPALRAWRWWNSLLLAAVVAGIGTLLIAFALERALRGLVSHGMISVMIAPLFLLLVVIAPSAALSHASGVGTRSFVIAALVATCCTSATTLLWRQLGVDVRDVTDAFSDWRGVRLSLADSVVLGAAWGAASAGVFAFLAQGDRKYSQAAVMLIALVAAWGFWSRNSFM